MLLYTFAIIWLCLIQSLTGIMTDRWVFHGMVILFKSKLVQLPSELQSL